jgi:hypothetical protein
MKYILSTILCLASSLAFAQGGPIIQSGNLTPGHPLMGIANGVAGDAGPALGGSLKELGITAPGTPFCIGDAPISSPYHQLCLGANSLGGGLISYDSKGGAPALPLEICVNSTCVQLPFTTTGVVGTSPTVVGDVVVWDNTVGTLISEGPPLRLDIPSGAQNLSFLPLGNAVTTLGSMHVVANSSASSNTRQFMTSLNFVSTTGVNANILQPAGCDCEGDRTPFYSSIEGGANSGNIWAENLLIQVDSVRPTSGHDQISEMDLVNLKGPVAPDLGPAGIGFPDPTNSGPYYAYGLIMEIGGFTGTAAIDVGGTLKGWHRGMGCDQTSAVADACYFDYGQSSRSIDIWGLHDVAIDLSHNVQSLASDASSILLPPEGNIGAITAGGSPVQRRLLVGDINNVVHLGDSTAGGWTGIIMDNNTNIRGTLSILDTPGASCSGTPTSSFATISGVVTHC